MDERGINAEEATILMLKIAGISFLKTFLIS